MCAHFVGHDGYFTELGCARGVTFGGTGQVGCTEYAAQRIKWLSFIEFTYTLLVNDDDNNDPCKKSACSPTFPPSSIPPVLLNGPAFYVSLVKFRNKQNMAKLIIVEILAKYVARDRNVCSW